MANHLDIHCKKADLLNIITALTNDWTEYHFVLTIAEKESEEE